MVFLKGYQWPFDSRKVIGGSSIVDILVYQENVLNGRRVFLDFRRNPEGFAFEDLSGEALAYLKKSSALQHVPIERLRAMNPGAIDLFYDHGIDLAAQPLEVAICAQHNNGGLAANHWWESLNIKHLFPIGEVNGSHGVYRPGGAALNSGQVGGLRAAEFIAHRYQSWSLDRQQVRQTAATRAARIGSWIQRCHGASQPWRSAAAELRQRMSRAGAHIRSIESAGKERDLAWRQWERINASGIGICGNREIADALVTRYLCFAHAVYLSAIEFVLSSGVGSRGSAIALDSRGTAVHPKLDSRWSIQPEDPAFRERVLETVARCDGTAEHRWIARRPIPQSDTWFETAWARFRSGEIYAIA